MVENFEKIDQFGGDHEDIRDKTQVQGAAQSKPSNSLSEIGSIDNKAGFEESDVLHDQSIRQGASRSVVSPLEDLYSSQRIVRQMDSTGSAISINIAEKEYGPRQHESTAPAKPLSLTGEDDMNVLSLTQVAPVDVLVHGLTVGVDLKPSGLKGLHIPFRKLPEKTTKIILNDVSARMPNGSLTAIIGASGSGKTSMLNVMSQRISDSRLKQSGNTLYNGNPNLSCVRTAYVMQQDVLLPTLTVRETLQYSADLRLPPPTTAKERRSIVEEVILELGLKDCANTRIGNSEHRGCSGGEKRRTSLGVQLLSNPSVLFLDEVTTGLDAASAFQLVKTLKLLAQKGRTIIITIHQPRSEIWGLFDYLVLLTGGSPLYTGPAVSCLEYFAAHGYVLPPFINPAEFLIDLAAVDTRSVELEEISRARVDGLKEAWKASPSSVLDMVHEKVASTSALEDPKPIKRRSVFGRQVRVQTLRTLKTTYRDPLGITGSLIEVFSMAIITGWIFYGLDGSLTGIRSREGALYTAAALQGYLILLYETYRMTLDIGVFDREYSEGVINVPSFLVSRRLARLITEDVVVPLIYSIIFYFMVGFRHNASQFFTFFAVTLLGQFLAVTLATLCVAVSRDLAGATLLANMSFTLQSVCSTSIHFFFQFDMK